MAGAGRTTGTRSGQRLTRTLVAAQLALSLLLVTGAGLLLRTMLRIMAVDPGFNTSHVVLVEIGKFRATMINPEITDVGSDDFHVWDDCFSFPNLLVRVTRAYRASLRYTDLKGKQVTMELEGPMAELLQHELDHLDGILAIDQPSGLDPFAYRAEWEKHHKPDERYGAPRPREV
jgi:peptide deformylase